jgi:DNA-binding NtrC family response regulator
MADSTMLLISVDTALIEAVHGVMNTLKNIRMEVVSDFDEACSWVDRRGISLVLAHLNRQCSVSNLTRLLSTMSATGASIPTLVVSDEYYAEQALALLRIGAADYLTRPLDLGRLAYLVDVLTFTARHARADAVASVAAVEPISLPDRDGSFTYLPLTKMGRMMEQLHRIAPQESTILLGGETGTGKTRLAGLIHQLSRRRDRPFVTINCGALSATLIESEMFGHVKGAFTGADLNRVGKFEQAGRGTLFLDEIDSLPASLQAKLLRAVEDRVFEPVGSNKTLPLQARLIAASNRPLEQEVAAGRFRADLFYRLNVVAFTPPPLRERAEGAAQLARGFVVEFARRMNRPVPELSAGVMRALDAHSWPGNIRELRNVIERAVALCDGTVIRFEDLPEGFRDPGLTEPARSAYPLSAAASTLAESMSTLAESKEAVEREQIAAALQRNGNNRLRAAADLGISRMTLYKKLHKFGLFGAPRLGTVALVD